MSTPEIYMLVFVIVVFVAVFLFLKRTKAECGHKTRLSGTINAYGRSTKVKLEPNEDGDIDYCLKCIEDMTIKCAWCEKPIFIGEPVTLYSPKNNDFDFPDDAHVYKENPLTFVGCRRMGCANSKPSYDGFWVPPGKVKKKSKFKEESEIGAPKAKGGVLPASF